MEPPYTSKILYSVTFFLIAIVIVIIMVTMLLFLSQRLCFSCHCPCCCDCRCPCCRESLVEGGKATLLEVLGSKSFGSESPGEGLKDAVTLWASTITTEKENKNTGNSEFEEKLKQHITKSLCCTHINNLKTKNSGYWPLVVHLKSIRTAVDPW